MKSRQEPLNLLKVILKLLLLISLTQIITSPVESQSPPLDSAGQTSYIYPLMDARLSSNFGTRKHPITKAIRHHDGLDLAAPQASPIRAIASGLVVFADPYSGYGNLVVILHPDGTSSHYGHNSKNLVTPGTHVKAGAIIALVGSTGLATGPHLHFEIRSNGKALDPLKIFPGLLVEAEG